MSQPEYSPARITRQRIILVEGKDDELLMKAICGRENLDQVIHILSYGQAGKLGRYLETLVRDKGFEAVTHVGLTKDSDNGVERALQSLEDAWARGVDTLNSIGRPTPSCSFFALPNNSDTGRLENLCLSAPAFPDILRCAEQMHECASGVSTYPIDREKSLVAAYLSMMQNSGLQLGTGAQAGCWNLQSETFGPLRTFVVSIGS